MQLGRLGVWTFLDAMSAEEAAGFARRVEALGYSALWIPEAVGRDPFAFLGYLAARTEHLLLATGIANIYARDPMAMRAIQKTLAELSGGRFLLGLGVSHEHLVSGLRQHQYRKPVQAMNVRPRFQLISPPCGHPPRAPLPAGTRDRFALIGTAATLRCSHESPACSLAGGYPCGQITARPRTSPRRRRS